MRLHWHQYSKWKEPTVINHVGFTFLVQERKCETCNRIEIRRVAA